MSHIEGRTGTVTKPVGGSHASPVTADLTEPLSTRIDNTELRRRLWHMSPGALSFFLWAFPHRDPISPTLRWIMTGIIAMLAARIFLGFKQIQRRNEADNQATWAVLGYAASVLMCLLVFPGQAEIALGVLGILAFGDGSATLGGLILRGPTLPWNADKSWSGFFSFIVVGTLMGALMYWGESHNLEARTPGVTWDIALKCVFLATVAAAIAESLPSRINDNIRVGIVSAVTLAIAHGHFVGWAG